MERTNFSREDFQAAQVATVYPVAGQPLAGDNRARKSYLRRYQQACDRFKRADRDLVETAAFVAASLTTATAIEAVMTVANDKLGLSKDILKEGFYIYIGIFLIIILYGLLRGGNALQRRARAEKEIDETKEKLYLYYPDEQWSKFEKE